MSRSGGLGETGTQSTTRSSNLSRNGSRISHSGGANPKGGDDSLLYSQFSPKTEYKAANPSMVMFGNVPVRITNPVIRSRSNCCHLQLLRVHKRTFQINFIFMLKTRILVWPLK